jgi:hypothetical protein
MHVVITKPLHTLRGMSQFVTFAIHAGQSVPDRYGGGREDDLR